MMLLPADLAVMRLGIHASWTPPKPTRFVGAATNPPAYGRIVGAERISGDNTRLSDCFPTACCNAVIDIASRFGKVAAVTNDTAVKAYMGMAGFNPADPATDQGTVPEIGFAWWQRNPIAGWILNAARPIDPQNEGDVRHAIDLGPVIFCQALSIENQNQRVLTDVGTPGSWGQHATCEDGYAGAITNGTSWGGPWWLDRCFMPRVLAAYALDVRNVA